MQKKTKIILAVVLSVLFLIGLALGLYFGLKDKADKTVFAKTGTVSVFDKNTLKFTYITPYFEDADFELTEEKGFYVTTGDKTIDGEIISIEYRPGEGEKVESGSIVITADLEESVVVGNSYHAVIKENSIVFEEEDYINPDITADFIVKEDDNGVFHAEEEKFKNAKAVVLSDVKPELYKKEGKAYFSITAKADGITSYNEEGAKNYQVFAGYSYKNSNGRFIRWLVNDIEFSAENGVIKITGSAMEDDLIPGTDYKLVIKKGFFTNDDMSVVNEEYEGNFTYVEQ